MKTRQETMRTRCDSGAGSRAARSTRQAAVLPEPPPGSRCRRVPVGRGPRLGRVPAPRSEASGLGAGRRSSAEARSLPPAALRPFLLTGAPGPRRAEPRPERGRGWSRAPRASEKPLVSVPSQPRVALVPQVDVPRTGGAP